MKTYPEYLHKFAVAVATRTRYLCETPPEEKTKEKEAELWAEVVKEGQALAR